MSDSQPHEALSLPFGDFEFNDAGEVVKVYLYGDNDNPSYEGEDGRKVTDAIVRSPALKEMIILLDNDNADYKGDDWRKVADAIVRSPALKEIALTCYASDCSSNRKALEAVFRRERTHPCALEELDAEGSILGPENLASMLPFFKSTPEIKTISLSGNDELRDEGIRLLSEVLDHTRIENLYLYDNRISGEGLGRLFSAKNSKHLHKLNLECNDIGSQGQEAICQFLQREDTEMRKLYFDFVDENQFQTMLESISPRSKLVAVLDKYESFGGLDEKSTAAMSQMLKNVVCNTDTFEDLCESNHQLAWVGRHMCKMLKSDPVLKKAITINNQLAHGASVIFRLRSKLRAFYFQGQFDVQPFIDMDVVLMPFVLALVTRTERVFSMDCDDERNRWTERDFSYDEGGCVSELAGGKCAVLMKGDLASVYHLVRNCHLPELFTFPSPKSRIQIYESRIASLEEENARLAAENKDLQVENEELQPQLSHPFFPLIDCRYFE